MAGTDRVMLVAALMRVFLLATRVHHLHEFSPIAVRLISPRPRSTLQATAQDRTGQTGRPWSLLHPFDPCLSTVHDAHL